MINAIGQKGHNLYLPYHFIFMSLAKQHYVIKFVSDLRQVGGFSGYSGFLQ